MPASGAIKLLDANVWLALAFSDHQHHVKAKSWFDSQANQVCAFCRISQLALLRHLTNSTIMGRFVQTQAQAWQTYERFLSDPRLTFLHEPSTIDVVFRRLTSAATPSHGRWTDAYLAAFAVAGQVQLVTFDRRLQPHHDLDLLVLV